VRSKLLTILRIVRLRAFACNNTNLCGWECWVITLRHKQRWEHLRTGVRRGIIGSKREKLKAEWRKCIIYSCTVRLFTRYPSNNATIPTLKSQKYLLAKFRIYHSYYKSPFRDFKVQWIPLLKSDSELYIYIYTHIYIYVCVCVCVCARARACVGKSYKLYSYA
jgi:hypothetical protein